MTTAELAQRARARGPRLWAGLLKHVREPLHRDGYALALSSAVTAAVGLCYWIVAARTYSPRLVGLNSALISAMMFVAGAATLNLANVLVRFLPHAGRGSRRFVLGCYAASTVVAVAAAVLFELAVAGSGLRFLSASPGLAVGFVLATAGWTLFVLQDGALTGLGKAVWVPVENGAFAIGKLALLAAFSGLGAYGIFASWTFATALAIAGVNVLLFARLLRRAGDPGERGVQVRSRSFGRYLVADWLCAMAWLASTTLLPIMVTAELGAEANAAFALAWALAFPLYTVAASLGTSLVLHGTREPAALPGLVRRTARQGTILLLGVVGVIELAAPLALSLFGGRYAADGASVLRLLAAGALPNLVLVLWVSSARVRRRLGGAVAALGAQSAITLISTPPLLHRFGVTGAGVAWLCGQCLVAAAVLATVARRQRPRRHEAGTARALVGRLPLRRMHTDSDVAVLAAGPLDAPLWMVKLAASDNGAARLAAHRDAVRTLRANPDLEDWGRLLPREVAAGDGWLVEAVVRGNDGRLVAPERVLGPIVDAMAPLYAATAAEAAPDAVGHWVQVRADRIGRMTCNGANRLADRLRDDLAGRALLTGWVHGDLWPGNVLVDADGSTLNGIVDWENARPDGLPAADVAHLVITTRALASGRAIGTVVRRLVDGRDVLAQAERAAMDAACPPGERLDPAAAALLAWFQHVDLRLGQAAPHPRGVWARRTLRPVLSHAGDRPHRATAPRTAPAARSLWLSPGPTGAAAVAERRPSSCTPPTHSLTSRPARLPGRTALGLAPVAVALLLWIASLRGVDLDAMTDAGLTSVLPPAFGAALAVLTVSFAATLARRRVSDLVAAAHAIALVVILHATPTILYGTLRYAWAWKHVGIVDYIQRHGTVDPYISYLTAYHDWPGFFALGALVTDATGQADALGLAQWGPPFFNLLFLGAVLLIARTLVSDTRLTWAAGWLFVLGNWVGQDYFSPQALCFFLYLAVVAVLLRARERNRVPVVVVLLLSGAVVMSHQLTPPMLVVAVAVLTITHLKRLRWLPLVVLVMTVGWIALFARPFLEQNLYWIADSIGSPSNNAAQGLRSLAAASHGMIVTAWAGRALTAAMIGLAALGFLRSAYGGSFERTAALLASCPIVLLGATSYSGEIVFRVFLFALPFLALLAAGAFFPTPRWRPSRAVAFAVVALALLAGTTRAYYGKEPIYHFFPSEVRVMERLYAAAPAGSLMLSGTFDYPWAFRHYEIYDYAALETEPTAVRRGVVAHPIRTLITLMQSHSVAYFIVTRSQEAAVDMTGVLPAGTLQRVAREMAATGTPQARAQRPRQPWYSVAYQANDVIVLRLERPAR